MRTVIVLISYPFVVLELFLHFFPDSKRLSQSHYEQLSEGTEGPQVSPVTLKFRLFSRSQIT